MGFDVEARAHEYLPQTTNSEQLLGSVVLRFAGRQDIQPLSIRGRVGKPEPMTLEAVLKNY